MTTHAACLGLSLLFLFGSGPAFASHEDGSSWARSIGMGEARASVGGDLGVLDYNPAGLGTLEELRFGAGYRRTRVISAGRTESSRVTAAAAFPSAALGRGSFGAFWTEDDIKDLSLDRAVGLGYGTRGFRDTDLGQFDIGLTIKQLSRGAARTGEKKAEISADLGAMLKTEYGTAGLAVLNVNSPSMDLPFNPEKAPLMIKAGYSQAVTDFLGSVDVTRRAESTRYDEGYTLALGLERWLRLARWGSVAARSGLNIGSDAKSWALGAGWKMFGGELDYAALIPLISEKKLGHAVNIVFRFGRWKPEHEYEKLLTSEIKYRQDLARSLIAAEARQKRVAEELERLRGQIERLRAELDAKTASEADARRRLRELEEMRRRAQISAEEAERERLELEKKSKETLFREEWAAFLKLKGENAPDVVLIERLKKLLREHKDSGVDLSEANQELVRLLRNRP